MLKDMEPKTSRAVGYTFGGGLPPIPLKLVAKIKQGDFVQMHELLPDYWWTLENEHDSVAQKWQSFIRQHLLDVRVWVQCFACYAGMVAASQPEQVPDLLTYLI